MTPAQKYIAMYRKHHHEYDHLPDAAKQAVNHLTSVTKEWQLFKETIYMLMTITDADIDNLPSKKISEVARIDEC